MKSRIYAAPAVIWLIFPSFQAGRIYLRSVQDEYKIGRDRFGILEKGALRLDRSPDYLASHARVPGSNTAETLKPCFSFSMWLGDHVNGSLVDLKFKTVYRR